MNDVEKGIKEIDCCELSFKPCPFCGSDNIRIGSHMSGKIHKDYSYEYVKCGNCGVSIQRKTLYNAYWAWNERASEKEKPPTA